MQIARIPVGQAPQALVYVPDAVPSDEALENLQPLGLAREATHLMLAAPASGAGSEGAAATSVSLFDQGLTQVLQAAIAGLVLRQPYVLALATQADGKGELTVLAAFETNPAGSAIVNAVGPIRQVVQNSVTTKDRRYLVIAPGTTASHSASVQVQVSD